MYTFNVSIHDSLAQPCQIMPRRNQGLYDISSINIEPGNENVLIHTSYITHIWSNKAFEYHSNQWLNLKNYFKLAQKIGSKYVLVHGPQSKEEYDLMYEGLKWLHNNFDEYMTDIKLVIEIPAFTKSFHMNIIDKYDFIDKYLQTLVDNGFDIVLDTAHLYANGLNCEQMVQLIDKYKSNFNWIHLNGNSKTQFTSDKHVFVLDESNKFGSEVEVLLKKISELNNCICVLETLDYKSVDTSLLDSEYGYKNLLSD
jgi:endonuclease IV